MSATLDAAPAAKVPPAKPKHVQALYRRLEANKAKRKAAVTKAKELDDTMADLWVALIAEGETQSDVARASGYSKSYVKKYLERRAARS
jgi:5'-deoxynucleotidase YfbR-like HD superfamily hydrolase